jgi:hypothetical protein
LAIKSSMAIISKLIKKLINSIILWLPIKTCQDLS